MTTNELAGQGVTRRDSTFVHRIESYDQYFRDYATVCGIRLKQGGEVKPVEQFRTTVYTQCGFCRKGVKR